MKTRQQRAAAAKMAFDGCGSRQCLMAAVDNVEGSGGDRQRQCLMVMMGGGIQWWGWRATASAIDGKAAGAKREG